MEKKSSLSIKEQQKLRVLLEAVEDSNKQDTDMAGRQEATKESSCCIEEGEIQRFIDLGLGRGIDASNPTPWQNKTSIQVRPVTFENIIGTEESGSVQSYEREITRVSETHWRFSPSAVFNPNLVGTFSIGVEESHMHPHSQSATKEYVVGTKVLNRTICFRETFDDSKLLDQLHPSSLVFEAWLCRWILKTFVREDGRPVDIEERIGMLKQEVLALNEENETVQCEFSEVKSKHEEIQGKNLVETMKAELQEMEHKKKMNKMEREKLENKKKWFLNTLEKEYKKTGQTDEKQYKMEEFDQDFKLQEIKVNKECDEIEGRITTLTEKCSNEIKKLEGVEARLQEVKVVLDKNTALLKEKTTELKRMESHQFSIDELRKRTDTPEIQCKQVAEYCAQFLAQFRITHYVSSIQLGASGYKVVARSEAAKSQKIRNSIRVDKIAAGKATSTPSKLRAKRNSATMNKIGIIEMEEDNKVIVPRRSHQEGVVGVRVKPISDLVTTAELRESLKEGILHYIRSEGDTSGYNYTEGPFLIRCVINEKTFYWRVDDFYSVKAEQCDVNEATEFYLKPRSHPDKLSEFYVIYYDSQNKKHTDPFMPHYLQRSVTVFDNRISSSVISNRVSQPLKFGRFSYDKDTPLVLYKVDTNLSDSAQASASTLRRNRHWINVSLSSWISESQQCILQHARRGMLSSAFVAAVVLPNVTVQEQPNMQTAEVEQQRDQGDPAQAEQGEQNEGAVREEQGTQQSQGIQESPDVHLQELFHEGDEGDKLKLMEPTEYQVSWLSTSDARVGVIKSFEIVSTSGRNE